MKITKLTAIIVAILFLSSCLRNTVGAGYIDVNTIYSSPASFDTSEYKGTTATKPLTAYNAIGLSSFYYKNCKITDGQCKDADVPSGSNITVNIIGDGVKAVRLGSSDEVMVSTENISGQPSNGNQSFVSGSNTITLNPAPTLVKNGYEFQTNYSLTGDASTNNGGFYPNLSTFAASVIAAQKNLTASNSNAGIHGIAYDATIASYNIGSYYYSQLSGDQYNGTTRKNAFGWGGMGNVLFGAVQDADNQDVVVSVSGSTATIKYNPHSCAYGANDPGSLTACNNDGTAAANGPANSNKFLYYFKEDSTEGYNNSIFKKITNATSSSSKNRITLIDDSYSESERTSLTPSDLVLIDPTNNANQTPIAEIRSLKTCDKDIGLFGTDGVARCFGSSDVVETTTTKTISIVTPTNIGDTAHSVKNNLKTFVTSYDGVIITPVGDGASYGVSDLVVDAVTADKVKYNNISQKTIIAAGTNNTIYLNSTDGNYYIGATCTGTTASTCSGGKKLITGKLSATAGYFGNEGFTSTVITPPSSLVSFYASIGRDIKSDEEHIFSNNIQIANKTDSSNRQVSGGLILNTSYGTVSYSAQNANYPAAYVKDVNEQAASSSFGKMLTVAGYNTVDNRISLFSNKCSSSISGFSNIEKYCIVAPNDTIANSPNGGTVIPIGNTSIAAAHVAGAVTLIADMAAKYSVTLTPEQIINILRIHALQLDNAGISGKISFDSSTGKPTTASAAKTFLKEYGGDDVVKAVNCLNGVTSNGCTKTWTASTVWGVGFLNLDFTLGNLGTPLIPTGTDFPTTTSSTTTSIATTSIVAGSAFGDALSATSTPIGKALSNVMTLDYFGFPAWHNLNLESNKTSFVHTNVWGLVDNYYSNNYTEFVPAKALGFTLLFSTPSDQIKNKFDYKYLANYDRSKKEILTEASLASAGFSQKISDKIEASFNFIGSDSSSIDLRNNHYLNGVDLISYNAFSDAYQGLLGTRRSSGKLTYNANDNIAIQTSFTSNNIEQGISGGGSATSSKVSYRSNGGSMISFTAGTNKEDRAFLGTRGTGALAIGSGAITNYYNISGVLNITNKLGFVVNLTQGFTTINGIENSLFKKFNNIRSEARSIGLIAKDFTAKDARIGLIYSEPLRISSGTVMMNVPVARTFDSITYQTTNANLKTTGQERNLEAFYSLPLNKTTHVTTNLLLRHEPNHIKDVRNEYVSLLRFTKEF